MRTIHKVTPPTSQKEYSKLLMKTLLIDIHTKWKSNIKDTDIVTVYKRTLKRNLSLLKGDIKQFCKMSQKMNNTQILILAIETSNEIGIDITPNEM